MRFCIILLTGLLIGACTPRQVPLPDPTQIPPEVDLQPYLVTTATNTDTMISIATADLASRFSLDLKDVRFLSIESQLWPDTALGCPRPGEVYAQQTVPGYRLRLEANGQEYVYHTDTDKTVILCLEEDQPSFPITPGEIDDDRPWMPVD